MAFSISRTLAETAIYPWSQEYMPKQIRGRISGVVSLAILPVAIGGSVIIQLWLDSRVGIERYFPVFVIGALCPWCLMVTVATTLGFFEITHVNIRDNNLYLPRRVKEFAQSAVRANLDLLLVVIWLLVLALLIVLKYGDALFA